MKILLINKFHYRKGGAERAYFDMADILTKAGHQVAFFAMAHPQNEPTPWSKYFVTEVDYHSQMSFFQKLGTARKMIWNSEANKNINELITEFQPDIAHCHNIYHQLSPSIFHTLKKRGVPIVLTLHDYKLVSPNYNLYAHGKIWDHSSGFRCLADRCIQGSFLKSLVCVLEKWLHSALKSYSLVDVLIAPSQFLADKVKALGWQGQEITVIPNPLRENELSSVPSTEAMVKNRLVFFGRLSEEKGILLLLEALALSPDKELVIIGDGPQRNALEAAAESLGIAKRVNFLGARYGQELQTELQKAEAVIVPSAWYENLPYVVTESLALGLVVIAADSGGIRERITDGKNGFLYPIGDGEVLAGILNNLNKEDLATIRSNAQKSVADLSPQVFLRKLENVYQQVRSH